MEQRGLDSLIPYKWRERFLIKRIGEPDVEISLEQRNEILKALNQGTRFVQVGKYTLMLNSIKSIDPLWGPVNIPPRPVRPKEDWEYIETEGVMVRKLTNEKEIKKWEREVGLWDKLFKNKIVPKLTP